MSQSHSNIGYKKDDLVAAQHMLTIHSAKLNKALDANDFASACSAIRAIEHECTHASRIATRLSFDAFQKRSGNAS